jgi:hypothetical protein
MELDSMYESGNLEEAVEAAKQGLTLCKEMQERGKEEFLQRIRSFDQ